MSNTFYFMRLTCDDRDVAYIERNHKDSLRHNVRIMCEKGSVGLGFGTWDNCLKIVHEFWKAQGWISPDELKFDLPAISEDEITIREGNQTICRTSKKALQEAGWISPDELKPLSMASAFKVRYEFKVHDKYWIKVGKDYYIAEVKEYEFWEETAKHFYVRIPTGYTYVSLDQVDSFYPCDDNGVFSVELRDAAIAAGVLPYLKEGK